MLFSRSAAVLGRPRRSEPPSQKTRTPFNLVTLQYAIDDDFRTGAAEDGRAPAEELSCLRERGF
jgi:hypothetical protein